MRTSLRYPDIVPPINQPVFSQQESDEYVIVNYTEGSK